jgi:CelD/BcsL family acetyltransferase involved in cellulose biosynthesis
LTFVRERPCPMMHLPPTYAELEELWGKGHRGTVRRKLRRIEREGAVELFVATTRTEIQDALPQLFAMHVKNWSARTGYSEFQSAGMAVLIEQLAANLPLELLHYSELQLNGRAISCHFGFNDRECMMWYKPTFDLEFGQFSPSLLHIAKAAEWCIGRGLTKLDFMQGAEPYKLLWSNSITETRSWVAARPVAYPFWLWQTRIRNLALEYRE